MLMLMAESIALCILWNAGKETRGLHGSAGIGSAVLQGKLD